GSSSYAITEAKRLVCSTARVLPLFLQLCLLVSARAHSAEPPSLPRLASVSCSSLYSVSFHLLGDHRVLHYLNHSLTKAARMKILSRCQEFMKDVMEAVSEFSVVDLYPSIGVLEVSYRVQEKNDKLHGEVDWILENIVTDPRDKITVGGGGGEDLVDILLRLQKQNDLQYPLSDSVVKAIILLQTKKRQ
ncbi:hypothetical protein HN51_023664, partial [Arachis hypogaea]